MANIATKMKSKNMNKPAAEADINLSIIFEESSRSLREVDPQMDVSDSLNSMRSMESGQSAVSSSLEDSMGSRGDRKGRKKYGKAQSSPLMESIWSTHSGAPIGNRRAYSPIRTPNHVQREKSPKRRSFFAKTKAEF